MKILYLANTRMPSEKAHTLQIAKMLEALVLTGQEVTLLLTNRKNEIKADIFDYYQLKVKFPVKHIINYFWFVQAANKKLYFKLVRLVFNLQAFGYGLFTQADAIYSREILVSYLLSLFGRPVVFEDHEPKNSKQWLYKFFLKNIKKKIVVPPGLAELYQRWGIKNYIMVPNAVDLAELDSFPVDKNVWQKEFNFSNSGDFVILYIGHFYRWKGVYTLLDAARKLAGDCKVVMIGGTKEDRSALREYIVDHQLAKVYLKEFVPHSQIYKYLKAADVLVLPNTAQEERSAKYTTPIKLFEYLGSGVPIVASDLPSFSYFLNDGKNALLFRPDEAADLAEKIMTIKDQPSVARDLTRQARETASRFTWQSRAAQIIDFIKP